MDDNQRKKHPSVALISLGCPKNLVDSEIILGLLSDRQYRITPRIDQADILIVNTCAFLESARREAHEVISKVSGGSGNHSRKLIVTGCLAQYYGARAPEIFPQADVILGVGEYEKLPELLKKASTGENISPRVSLKETPHFPFRSVPPRRLSTPGHLAYLRIADGCDNHCTYCLIPKLRGSYQERPRNILLEEAGQLVKAGVKELVLIAQETTYYGRGGKGEGGLFSLLRDLNDIPGLEWIRIMYTHPERVSRQLLQTISECDKVCPYLDIPLQHINDTILDRMGRNISRSRIEEVLGRARDLIPGISIRTTMMVGFPGEEGKEFSELVDFVINQRFENLGVFVYSPEAGTVALDYGPGVDPDKADHRRDILMEIQQGISAERMKGFIGKTIDVLVDSNYPEADSDLMVGRGIFQAPEIDGVVVMEGDNLRPGEMVKVKITDSSEYDLYGISIN